VLSPEPLALTLAAAALLIGLTGTWSPCGFSMVETIGPTGHTGGRRTTLAACATFLPGALAGGIATFGALAVGGQLLHGAGGRVAYAAAAAIAVLAALAEARAAPIAPQIRRQLPEHWRRAMPMPLAAALYGALLGLGFTTFVLSFGVWALAAICFAVGEPELGLLVGVAFGLGRALPIVALAPAAGTPLGARSIELMAGGGLYRGFRLGDALALALAAIALGAGGGDATAAQTVVPNGADPSAADADLVYQAQDRSGVLLRDGQEIPLHGTDPAVGGPYVAVIDAGAVIVRRRDTLEEVTRIAVPGVDALAISGDWLVVRRREGGRDVLEALRITDPLAPGAPQRITSAGSPSQIGRPSVDGDTMVWATAQRDESRIWKRDLGATKNKIVVGSRFGLLTNPALEDGHLIYVRSGGSRDQVMALRLGSRGAGHPIYRESGAGILWSTALEGGRAYVTVLSDGGLEIITVN
jgi:hypothetical protein